jgi:hypothetical protein
VPLLHVEGGRAGRSAAVCVFEGTSHMTERVKVSTQLAMTVIGWVVSVLLAYGAMNVRIAVVEDRVNRLQSDVAEIKQDVKTLLRRTP